MNNRLRVIAIFAGLCVAALAYGDKSLLLLYTGDLHDHVRPGIGGLGGLPYVSGYVQSERAKQPNLLLVDAGDVTEKGDMVATETVSALTYEALGKIGYSAVAIGNHDTSYPVEHLKKCAAAGPSYELLCLNWADASGKNYFNPSRVVEIGGVKVGIIGSTRVSDEDYKQVAAAMESEARKLKPTVDLVIAICHFGTKDCLRVSELAPSVRIFVAGHTHEKLAKPTSSANGATIVSAGSYARYVGRLAVTVRDDGSVKADGELVEMKQDSVPCDNAMLAWVKQREQELCPEASTVVAQCERKLDTVSMARFAAAALRHKSGADVAFCHPGQIMREVLLPGPVDVNALFLTGGQKGKPVVSLTLTGREIEQYIKGLDVKEREQTQWSGYRVSPNGGTDLDKGKSYRVVMPRLEWDTRCKEILNSPVTPEVLPFRWIDALADYAKYLAQENITLDAQVDKLTAMNVLQAEKARK
jgi:2',3'-cyclic-nucleotide 2'-phosphodiesterase (5'-nucleotidase family)